MKKTKNYIKKIILILFLTSYYNHSNAEIIQQNVIKNNVIEPENSSSDELKSESLNLRSNFVKKDQIIFSNNTRDNKINYGLGLSLGHKSKIDFLSSSHNKILQNNFIATDLFIVKNLYKQKYGDISLLSGVRLGVGHNFEKFYTILGINFVEIDLIDSYRNNFFENISVLPSISFGYEINKIFDIRFNTISSFGQKIAQAKSIKNFAVTNCDLTLAIKF